VVLAVSNDSPVRSLAELAALPGESGKLRISTEYPELTRKILAGHGSALRAAGLRIIETLLVSYTELIANPAAAADPAKRHAMEQIMTLLQGTLEARGKVLVKLNVSADELDGVLSVLPSMRAPTISELSGGGAFALEAVVAKSDINILIPALRDKGATDILEIPLSKIVH
jgi:ATP phosphoribosyltransferase